MVAAVHSPKLIQVSETEAARILNLSPRTLFNRRRDGKIAFVRDNGKVLYRLDELDRYSKANEVPAAI